jgi:hypothetical protein
MKQLVLGQQAGSGQAGSSRRCGPLRRLLRYVETATYDAGRVLINEGLAIARDDSRDGYDAHPREAAYVAADAASQNCVNTPPAPPTTPPPAGCDPSYPGVCIPPAPPDLDCGDIVRRNFAVLPPDPHGFDGDAEGVGCET